MKKLTEKELMYLIDSLVEEKVKTNEDFLRFTFYEVMIKGQVAKNQESEFLWLAKNKLDNLRYKVYFQDQQFTYNKTIMKVQQNELLIAVKE